MTKSPFSRYEDPTKHMVSLLSKEADYAGIPLSEAEKKILASESSRRKPLSEELRQKAKTLIEQILEREKRAFTELDPKNFGNSLEWAGDQNFPNIVALTEEVITGGGFGGLPRLRGRRWIKDRAQLIGCALLVWLFMLLVIGITSYIFQGK